ncbi:MAG: hypothetical protein WCG55_02720 [bacterium]
MLLAACSTTSTKKQSLTASVPDTTHFFESTPDTAFDENKPFCTLSFGLDFKGDGVETTLVKYSFYKRRSDTIDLTTVKSIATQMLMLPGTSASYFVFRKEWTAFASTDTLVIEHRTLGWKTVIEPLPKDYLPTVEIAVQNALPFAIKYWKETGLQFKKSRIEFIHYGSKKKIASDAFAVTLTGRQYQQHVGRVDWFFNGTNVGGTTGTIELNTYGESGQNIDYYRATDTSWEMQNVFEKPITIDAVNPSQAETFESVFYEVLHKIVSQKRLQASLDSLNRPPYAKNPEKILSDYTRYDEVAVHYMGICLMQEMVRQKLFPGGIITDPVKKYTGNPIYEGILPLIKKYPPSLENGKKIMRAYMIDPRNIDKL